jgi:lipoprotein-anchoring transpeptidase ErfK/SrfK
MKRLIIPAILVFGGLFLVQTNAHATSLDRDIDGLADDAEVQVYGTHPDLPDTDYDTVLDGEEIKRGSDPLNAKSRVSTPEPKAPAVDWTVFKGTKRIDVDLSEQRLRYYVGETMVDSILISSGTKKYPSPIGTFSVLAKIPIKAYSGPGYYLPNTKWNMRFSNAGYYIHGAYWHNNFGRTMSHGCINVSYADMPQLYSFADVGTKITIHQ